jgi:hypothetical protein
MMHHRRTEPRLEEIQLAEAPEVLKVASELYARDRAEMEQAARRQELLRAAAEAGLPPEYLDRAATLIQTQRAERHRRGRRWRTSATLGLALGIALFGRLAGKQFLAPPPVLVPPITLAPIANPAPIAEPAPVPIGHFEPVDMSEQITHRLDQSMLEAAGNDIADVGAGLRTIDGVPFDLKGVVLVGSGMTEGDRTSGPVALPASVTGIPIGRKARVLYFLQGTHFSTRPGTRIGAYIAHYRDGSRAEIPLRFGEDVLDWWQGAGPQTEEASSHAVWHGSNEAAASHGTGIQLFMKSWQNPNPDTPIETLDMVTGDQSAGRGSPAPFLVGLTAQ